MNPILLDFPEEITTARLRLRPPAMADAADMNRAIDESRERLLPWMPWAQAERMTTAQRAAWCMESYARFLLRQDLLFLMFDRANSRFLGGTGLHRLDWSVPAMEVGYWIRTGAEGHGYVSEAVGALTDFAFQVLKAHRLEIRCDAANVRSVAVAKRAGYQLEARLKNQRRHHITGELRDTLLFASTLPD
jgi:RimJ/RimL family protein N-acetyltransferase